MGAIRVEVAGPGRCLVRLPRSATRRGAVAYCKLLRTVKPDRIWGGWAFEGELLSPGGTVPEAEIGEAGLLLECAGAQPGGRGHIRAPTLYILWRYDRAGGRWRELARTAAANRDWTVDLGPIARRELEPPRPVLVYPEGVADRVLATLDKELGLLRREAQCLVVRAVYDRFAARMAAG